MYRVALRGLLTRKLRTALTTLAVVIGVAFVAGTFVFTDTINESFKDLFQRTTKGTDVAVTAKAAVDSDQGDLGRSLPASVLATVRGLPDVAEATGQVNGQVSLRTTAGKSLQTGGAPTLLGAIAPERFSSLEYKAGKPPADASEIVLNTGTADKHDLKVGDRVIVAGETSARRYTISGLATLADVENLGGASFVGMPLAEAQRVAGIAGRYSEVDIAASRGTSPNELKVAVNRALQGVDAGPLRVETGQESADRQAKDIGSALGFLTTALLVFAGVALLVGGFLIFNTFSVTVAQRSRELALLRTLGASRRQVMRSVLAETVVIGLLASVVGVLAGVALAPGLRALLAAFGADLPNTGTVIAPRTVIAGFAVGMIATIISGFVPARRATRVEPLEAMREGSLPGDVRIGRRRIGGAVLLGAVGVGALLLGLFGGGGSAGSDAALMGVGAVALMFGVALLAPLLVRPLARLAGRPLERIGGLPGRLARENAERQPQRTAVTASALMVGLALVVFVSVFAAGLKASVTKVVDDQVKGQLVVLGDDGFSPIPAQSAQALARVPGVTTVSPLQFASGQVRGVTGTTSATGVDPATFAKTLSLKWVKGSDATLSQLASGGVVVTKGWADKHKEQVGSTISVLTPTGKRPSYRIVGTFDNKVGLTGDLLVSTASMRKDWGVAQDAFTIVAGTSSPAALKRAAAPVKRAFPSAKISTTEEFKNDQAAQVDQLVGLVYALLSLSVIVALLGIVNTLALSVFERMRELGMLRAVGMSRRQVRRMIRGESVITALIGAVLGLVLGIVLAALVSRPLASEGFVFTLPLGTLVTVTVLAGVAGVLAAVPPGRRAARVDVLRAVTAE